MRYKNKQHAPQHKHHTLPLAEHIHQQLLGMTVKAGVLHVQAEKAGRQAAEAACNEIMQQQQVAP